MRTMAKLFSSIATLAVIASPELAGQIRQREYFNEYGVVVKDASGRRINYTREQLAAQAARAPQRAVPLPSPQTPEPVFTVAFRPVWAYASFGNSVGLSNIVVADAGPSKEIYVGASMTNFCCNDYWYALRYQPQTASYEQVFVSPTYGHARFIQRIVTANVLGNAGLEILIGLYDGRVEFYDQVSKTRVGGIRTIVSGLSGLAVADLDRDGQNEILISTYNQFWVYSSTGTLKWHLATAGGSDIVVAQMDGDAALEIALSGTFAVDVVDAVTKSVQCTLPSTGFVLDLKAADIDGDGKAELIVGQEFGFVRAYDVDTQLEKWSIPVSNVRAIAVTDINRDSVFDLLVGEGQWGAIRAFNTVTQAEQWSIPNPQHGVTSIATGDVDRDGDVELLWGAGQSADGPNRLYVANWKTRTIEWENLQLDGQFVGPALGDLDGDGVAEVVVVSSTSDNARGTGRIVAFDSRNLALKGISEQVAGGIPFSAQVRDLKLRDVDGDGNLEVLIAGARLHEGMVEIYDFETGSYRLKWAKGTGVNFSPFQSVDAADVDGDGKLEIVAGSTGEPGAFLYVYDYASGTEEWRAPLVGDTHQADPQIAILDLDLDGNNEIAAITYAGILYIFDGKTRILETTIPSFSYTSVQALKLPFPLLLFTDRFGHISARVYIGSKYEEVFRQQVAPQWINGASLGPLSALWIGSAGRLMLVGQNGIPWQSAAYGSVYGKRVIQLPGQNIVVSAGSYSVNAFVWSSAAGQLGAPDLTRPR